MIKQIFPIIFILLTGCNINDNINRDFGFYIEDNKVTIFGYDGNKRNIIIPNYFNGYPVVFISKDAFRNRGIQSVILPENLEIIKDGAFANNQITNITFPDTVYSIGEQAFAWNKLKNVTIPSHVIYIKPKMFCFNELTSVNLHNNIQSIDYGAFSQNYLTDILLPDSLTFIGAEAFSRNKIKSIFIEENIDIRVNAFDDDFDIFYLNNNKKSGNYIYDNGSWSYSESNSSYGINKDDNKDKTSLLQCPRGKTNVFTIPNSVTSIDEYAFRNCTKLTGITIPNSVTSIDYSTFYQCSSLTA